MTSRVIIIMKILIDGPALKDILPANQPSVEKTALCSGHWHVNGSVPIVGPGQSEYAD